MSSDSTPGTLELFAIEISKIFNPLEERVASGAILTLMAELGLQFPDSLASDASFTSAISTVSGDLTALPGLVSDLVNAIKDEEYETAAEKSIDLVTKIASIVTNMETIADAIKAKKSDFIGDGLTAAEVEDFALNLAKNLLDFLIVSYIESNVPVLAAFLEFFGIIDRSEQNIGSTNPVRPPYTKRTITYNNILTFFKSPTDLLKTLYKWGDPTFDGVLLLEKLNKILLSIGLPVIYDSASTPPKLDLYIAELSPKTDITPKGLQLLFSEVIRAEGSYEFKQDNWSLIFGVGATIPVSAGMTIQPNGNLTIIPPSGSFNGKASIKFVAKDNLTGQPFVIVGDPQASRFQAKEISAEAGVDFAWSAGNATGVLHVEGEIKEGKIIIKPGNPDGFLAKILPAEGFEIDFGFIVGISSDKGFYFKNTGVLQVDFPVSISLGPIELQNLSIGIVPDNSKFGIALGTTIKAELGPLTAVVENMGLQANFKFPPNHDGNLGMIDVGIDFKPPNGIGLAIDTAGFKGGGYLFFDFENEQYAGAIELAFQNIFTLTAVGLVTTRFPDGSKGFSLLIIICVEFGTPIALGLNFYLKGVGGLLGLHRTIMVEELRKGVQENTIDNIMFPQNVIANIAAIISDLRRIFPTQRDQFAVGLMAKIVWSSPPLITVEIGLIIEFSNPVRIVILGVLKAALPTPDNVIVQIQVNFLGIIDFDKGMLSFDASIVNSKILCITLEGDMALRLSWGEKKDFLLSVGGFHPSFTPPSYLMLPKMKRITISLLSGNPNLTLTSYFAITTNTVQFGAAISFSFTISKFGIFGYFGFDVLFQFSPFYFIANISASVEVKLGSCTLFSISLSFELSGPTPWHAKGTAKFSILFFSFKVKFDKTFGEKQEVSLPSIEVLPLVLDEFRKDTSWETAIPDNRFLLVSVRSITPVAGEIVIQSFGTLIISQKLAPLDIEMSMYGNNIPSDIKKINVKNVSIGGEDIAFEDAQDSFAPAFYKKMEDDDKLSAPSYENQKSGIKVTSTKELNFDYSINKKVKYEVVTSDFESEPVKLTELQAINVSRFKPFISGGDIGKSSLSKQLKAKDIVVKNKVTINDELYTIVSNEDLSRYTVGGNAFKFSSKAEADDQLKQIIKNQPNLKGTLQLIPDYELAE
jgi:hypothetical protein